MYQDRLTQNDWSFTQPLSMMTVDHKLRNSVKSYDPLTVKVLETKEKKQRLLKELLGEEYIVNDHEKLKDNSGLETYSADKDTKRSSIQKRGSIDIEAKSFPLLNNFTEEFLEQSSFTHNENSRRKSVTDLRTTNKSKIDILKNKQKLDFFLDENKQLPNFDAEKIIESRSSFKFDTSGSDITHLIKEEVTSQGIIKSILTRFNLISSGVEVSNNQKFNCEKKEHHLSYCLSDLATTKNIALFENRLKRDSDLETLWSTSYKLDRDKSSRIEIVSKAGEFIQVVKGNWPDALNQNYRSPRKKANRHLGADSALNLRTEFEYEPNISKYVSFKAHRPIKFDFFEHYMLIVERNSPLTSSEIEPIEITKFHENSLGYMHATGSCRSNIIEFELKSILLKNHPLLIEEEIIVAEILQIKKDLRINLEKYKNLLVDVTSKFFEAIDDLKSTSIEDEDKSKGELANIQSSKVIFVKEVIRKLANIRKFFEWRHSILKEIRSKRIRLMSKCEYVKHLRQIQLFTSTRVKFKDPIICEEKIKELETREVSLIEDGLKKTIYLSESILKTLGAAFFYTFNNASFNNDLEFFRKIIKSAPKEQILDTVDKNLNINQDSITNYNQDDYILLADGRYPGEMNFLDYQYDCIVCDTEEVVITPFKDCPITEQSRRIVLYKWLCNLKISLHFDGSPVKFSSSIDLSKEKNLASFVPCNEINKFSRQSVKIPTNLFEAYKDKKITNQEPAYQVKIIKSKSKFQEFIGKICPALGDWNNGYFVGQSWFLKLPSSEEVSRQEIITFGETIQFELTIIVKNILGIGCSVERTQACQAIDILYSSIFKKNQSVLANEYCKLADLVEFVDESLLIYLCGFQNDYLNKKMQEKKLIVDDGHLETLQLVRFNDEEKETDGRHQSRLGRGNKINVYFRQKLLEWRWLNSIRDPIYLSDRDNIRIYSPSKQQKYLTTLLDTYKETSSNQEATKLIEKSSNLVVLKSTLRKIEHIRFTAVEQLRQFEVNVNELVKQVLAPKKLKTFIEWNDLVNEKKIELDLGVFINSLVKFKLKKPERRPLMARRNQTIQGQHLPVTLIHHESLDNLHKPSVVQDLELGTSMTKQQKSTAEHKSISDKNGLLIKTKNMQIIVTVLQAFNIPLRVVTSSPMSGASSGGTVSPHPGYPGLSPSPNLMMMTQLTHTSFVKSWRNISSQMLTLPTTFVEILYKHEHRATSLAHGSNPTWNETFFIPMNVLNNQNQKVDQRLSSITNSSSHLTKVNSLMDEFIQINLYDYYAVPNKQYRLNPHTSSALSTLRVDDLSHIQQTFDDSHQTQMMSTQFIASQQKFEQHLLGSLRIPVSNLLSMGHIEGIVALNHPLFLDNYKFDSSHNTLFAADQQHNFLRPNFNTNNTTDTIAGSHKISNQSHISFYITLDPPITLSKSLYLPCKAVELPNLFEYARYWERVLTNYFHKEKNSIAPPVIAPSDIKNHWINRSSSSRHIKALILNSEAKYCIATRYLTPQKPPLIDLLDKTKFEGADPDDKKSQFTNMPIDVKISRLARFVSLLSPIKHGIFNNRLLAQHVWFNNHQLVNDCLGGDEERCILFCNYLLHMGLCAGLVLGDALPVGHCIRVIIWRDSSNDSDHREELLMQAAALHNSQTIHQNSTYFTNNQNDDGEYLHNQSIDQTNFLAKFPIILKQDKVCIWNPCDASAYHLNDNPHLLDSSLSNIGCIITPENIYANIQTRIEQTSKLNFDIRNSNSWFTLFDSITNNYTNTISNFRRPLLTGRLQKRAKLEHLVKLRRKFNAIQLPTIQPMNDSLFDYSVIDQNLCKQIKNAIEQELKSKIIQWRAKRPTFFNRTLSTLISDKFKDFEGHLLLSIPQTNLEQDEASNNLPLGATKSERNPMNKLELAELIRKELSSGYLSISSMTNHPKKVIGSPINVPFTSVQNLTQLVYASGIHLADFAEEANDQYSSSLSLQFIVSAYVHSYPAKVLSVWLLVGAIISSN